MLSHVLVNDWGFSSQYSAFPGLLLPMNWVAYQGKIEQAGLALPEDPYPPYRPLSVPNPAPGKPLEPTGYASDFTVYLGDAVTGQPFRNYEFDRAVVGKPALAFLYCVAWNIGDLVFD